MARATAEPAAATAVTPQGARTREALLDAGVAVAERDGLSGLSVNAVVGEAGVAKGTFYVHFADRDAFVDALHGRFYAGVDAAIAAATADLPPGAGRLVAGLDAYLDACLAQRGVKALLVESRGDASATTALAARHDRFAALAAPSLEALGWRDARVAARLLVAATSEAALIELERGRGVPAARRALRALVERPAGDR